MIRFDPLRPFAQVYGSERGIKFSQDGNDFDRLGNLVPPLPVKDDKDDKDDKVIETDELASAKAFLVQILKQPLSKPTIYKAAEGNNQRWTVVRKAANQLGVLSFKFREMEHWKLPESLQ